MLQHLGFPDRWTSWVHNILSAGTSSVILNGVPGRKFKSKRGVRQGDPLSPLLFVLAAELLQILVNRAAAHGTLQFPITRHEGEDFPIVQYADDTLLILQADENQLLSLKDLLSDFAISTGLKVNYSKSQILPINVSAEKMNTLANVLDCKVGSFPFTYLGLPMGTTKPRVEDFTPLMDRIERRLTSCSSLLSYTGRLEMVNTVLSSTATYAMCSLKLPKGVIDNIDRARKQCLWRGQSQQKKGGNLAAWPMVMKPKEKGGLGIINLNIQNDALLIKHLHKFYNRADVPWVNFIWHNHYMNRVPHATREVGSFWWKDVLRLNTLFRGIARCHIGNGKTVTFWDDLWSDQVLAQQFPCLLTYATENSLKISVSQAAVAQELDSLFNLPLSQQAFEEFQRLNDILTTVHLDSQANDSWVYQWGNNIYSSRKFYKMAFQNIPAHLFSIGYGNQNAPPG
jgi:hypothetical protein